MGDPKKKAGKSKPKSNLQISNAQAKKKTQSRNSDELAKARAEALAKRKSNYQAGQRTPKSAAEKRADLAKKNPQPKKAAQPKRSTSPQKAIVPTSYRKKAARTAGPPKKVFAPAPKKKK